MTFLGRKGDFIQAIFFLGIVLYALGCTLPPTGRRVVIGEETSSSPTRAEKTYPLPFNTVWLATQEALYRMSIKVIRRVNMVDRGEIQASIKGLRISVDVTAINPKSTHIKVDTARTDPRQETITPAEILHEITQLLREERG